MVIYKRFTECIADAEKQQTEQDLMFLLEQHLNNKQTQQHNQHCLNYFLINWSFFKYS